LQPDLSVNIGSLNLDNPTILAAGILGLSASSLKRAVESGAAAVSTKSIGIEPRAGYINPTIAEVDCGLLNAMGLPNPGVDIYVKEIRLAKEWKIKTIASIFGASTMEFIRIAKMVEEAGADAIELNVSCPHVVAMGMQIGQDPKLVEEISHAVKSEVHIPVFTKLSPNVSDIVEIANAAAKGGSDAITAVNTVRAMAIDIETGYPVLANKIGGLSGPAIKPIAIRCVYEIARSVKIPVIGCGGIMTWEDAVEFVLAGATAVQLGTAVAYRGLNVFKEITSGIEKYLERKGFGSLKEIVGLSHRY